jgi:hypothetical protein
MRNGDIAPSLRLLVPLTVLQISLAFVLSSSQIQQGREEDAQEGILQFMMI